MPKDTQQDLMPAESKDDASAAQITALVGSVMDGLRPMAEQQAQVQLAQIAAARERDERAFRFARTTLFTTVGFLFALLVLLACATAFLFGHGSEQAGLQVIWFALGTLSGAGVTRIGKSRQ